LKSAVVLFQRIAAVLVLVFGAYLAVSAIALLGGWADVDLSRGGKVEVGLGFAFGAALCFCLGAALFRAARKNS
jgi:hypothetical protein